MLVALGTANGRRLVTGWGRRPVPLRRPGGKLVFALPGGYSVESDRKA